MRIRVELNGTSNTEASMTALLMTIVTKTTEPTREIAMAIFKLLLTGGAA